MPNRTIEMTPREADLFAACSKEALFALVRQFARGETPFTGNWMAEVEGRLNRLANDGEIPAHFANVLSRRKNHTNVSMTRKGGRRA